MYHQFMEVWPNILGPLLVHQDGTYLTRFQFKAILKKMCSGSGMGGRQFQNAFVQDATEAADLVLPAANIMGIGCWRSGRYKLYVCPQH